MLRALTAGETAFTAPINSFHFEKLVCLALYLEYLSVFEQLMRFSGVEPLLSRMNYATFQQRVLACILE